MNMPVRPAGQPGLHFGGLVSGIIIHHDVNIEALGHAGVNLFEEIKKLKRPVAFIALADNKTRSNIKSRKQRGGAVAHIIIPTAANTDPFDGSKPLHSDRRSVQGDLGDRASTATTPMGGFEPPSAGCFCPPAALRAAYGTSTTAQHAPVWRIKSIRSNGSVLTAVGIMRAPLRHSRHHRQNRLLAVQRLYLALLVHTKHNRPVGR